MDRDTLPRAGGAKPPVLLSRLPITAPDLPDRPSPAPTPLTLTYCSRLSGQKGPRCEAWLHAIALLPGRQQKKFTVDFLTKTTKVNEGEVPQYYVKGRHEGLPCARPASQDHSVCEIA